MLRQPGGRPAAAKHSAISAAAPGASSDGLNTQVLPASSAGTICPFGRWPGKLNGPNTAITPCGRCVSWDDPNAAASVFSPARSFWAAMETPILAFIVAASPRESHSALPMSRLITSAMASARLPISSAYRSRMAVRSACGRRDQSRNALRADATASATSAPSAAAPCHVTSPVAGHVLANFAPRPPRHFPSI